MRPNEYAFRAIERNRTRLTRQQSRTLIGQVKAGYPEAALKGMSKLLQEESK